MAAAGFFLAAVLGVLSFPPIGLWPVAHFALIPFLASATSLSLRNPFRWGWLSGFVFFFGVLYWIGLNSGAPPFLTWPSVVATVAILATIWGAVAWGVNRVSNRLGYRWAALLFVILYVFFEVFWGTGEMGFPWAIWALTQSTFLPAAQFAEIGDLYGLSLWVLTVNALIFVAWKDPLHRRRFTLAACLVFAAVILYGSVRLLTFPKGKPVKVAAVQANTPATFKWEMTLEDIATKYFTLTRDLTDEKPVLTVWPETATPAPLRYRSWLLDSLRNIASDLGSAILTGASDYEYDSLSGRVTYNAAFLIRPNSFSLERSAKIHLVPFGERIPGQKYLPFLRSLHLGQAEWQPGKSVVVFPASGELPATACLICFEVVFPDIAADMIRRGAQLLTTITNDGWYGNSSGPYQHLQLARLRAIATRRSMVRAAETGISALIDPTGRVVSRLGYNQEGSIIGELPLHAQITLSARLARVWPGFYTALLVLTLILIAVRGRRMRAA